MQRERQSSSKRETEGDRPTGDRDKQIDMQTDSQTERERGRERQAERRSDKNSDKETRTQRERERERDGQRWTKTTSGRETRRQRPRQGDNETETDRRAGRYVNVETEQPNLDKRRQIANLGLKVVINQASECKQIM